MTEPIATPTTVVMSAEQIAALPPEHAAARREAIRADRKSPFNNLMHRDHERSVDEMLALTGRALPAPKAEPAIGGLRVARPEPEELEPEPEPLVIELAPLGGGLGEWASDDVLAATAKAAEAAGWQFRSMAATLQAVTWNGLPPKPLSQDECLEALVAERGEEASLQILKDAHAWAGTLPAPMQAWLREKNLENVPKLWVAAAHAWRNRRKPAS